MPANTGQKCTHRVRYGFSNRQIVGPGVGAQLDNDVRRQFERNGDVRLVQRNRRRHLLCLLQIAISLTTRKPELLGQCLGSIDQCVTKRDKVKSRIQALNHFGMGRSRHVTYLYYSLRRKSRTKFERHKAISRSNSKLSFASME